MSNKVETPIGRLESDLRALIEPERAQFVDMAFKYLKGRIDRFLEERKPNKTFYDVYKQYNTYLLPGLDEATDYVESEKKMRDDRGWDTRLEPDFEVNYKPDGEERLRKLAADMAEEQIQTFLRRALDKLGPVVERHPDVKVTKQGNRDGHLDGAWVGHLKFAWNSGVSFVARMKIITNYSGRGNAYSQYPMTFHDASNMASRGSEGWLASPSIEEIWAFFGYNPPPKPVGPPRKKWTKLVSGSVIEVDGKPVLVHTSGQVKKQGLPADAPQIARIDVHHIKAYLERVDGTTDHHRFTEEEKKATDAIENDYNLAGHYDKAKKLRREQAFKVFFPDA